MKVITMSNEQKIARKLSAIKGADVKGYSIMMSEDEVFTIKALKAYRQIMSDIILQQSGRVVEKIDRMLQNNKNPALTNECQKTRRN
jgi:hypothetical protein